MLTWVLWIQITFTTTCTDLAVCTPYVHMAEPQRSERLELTQAECAARGAFYEEVGSFVRAINGGVFTTTTRTWCELEQAEG